MEIRFCNKRDVEQVKNIWEYCFNDSPEYVDFYFENKFNPESTIALDDEGRIISSIHLNNHTLNMYFKEFEVPYVVGVSTLPEARGIGRMGELMNASLQYMYNEGYEISILMPIDFRLYTKYGFENCYDILVQNVKVDDLKKFKITGNFRKAEEPEELEEIYRYSQSGYNGYSVRDEVYFEQFIDEMERDGGHIYINYIDSEPEGYIAYSIDNDNMIVRECYFKTVQSYKSMLKFIFNHNTQVKTAEIYSPVDDVLRHMLDNPKDGQFEIKPFMMGRIVNLEKFTDKLDIPADEEFMPFKIAVKDAQLEGNNGIFEFYNDEGSVKVNKIGEIQEVEDIDIFTVNEISALMFGYMEIEKLDFMRDEKINCIIELRELLNSIKEGKKANHINEYV